MSGWWAAAFVVQWVLLAALAVVVVALARQVGVLHLRLAPVGALEVDEEGPPLGSTPEPRLASPKEGERLVLGGPGEPRLVAFVSATCPICDALRPSLPAAARAAGLRATGRFPTAMPSVPSPCPASRSWSCSTTSAWSAPRGR